MLLSDEEDYRNILSDGSEEEVDQEVGEVAPPVQANLRRSPKADRTERFKQRWVKDGSERSVFAFILLFLIYL